MQITISIGDIFAKYDLNNTEIIKYFKPFIVDQQEECPIISVSPELMEKQKIVEFPSSPIEIEIALLVYLTTNALLPYHRCIFHGTAFLWQGKAWLFTAPSGTGKTTQFKRWKALYRNEVRILNGDKPILEFMPDGQIMVHPSPWKGKERWGGMLKAPLAGIIYLEQGKENKITRIKPQEAVIPIYKQFLFLPETGEAIHAVCQLEDVLLRNIPVWKLVNLGDLDSAQLTHSVLLKYLEDKA